MNRIILITGLMAAGKTTIAQEVAERLPKSVHLHGDIFRTMIVSGRIDMSKEAGEEAYEQLKLRYQLTAQAAWTYFENGFNVIIQDNYYCEMLPYMLSLLKGLPVETIVLCPSIEAIVRREAERSKSGYTGYDIRPLYEDFMKGTPRIGHWIDNGNKTINETVSEILGK